MRVSTPTLKGPSVLVVDSDPAIRLLVRRGFAAAGYRVYDSEPGPEVGGLIHERKPDVVLLDCDETETGGLNTIRSLRRISAAPILVLSARGDEDATVDALESGADDYVRKPFGTKELLARVKNALHRRALEQGKPAVLVSDDFEIDLIHRRVRTRGREVYLARKPYEVLRVMAEGAGKVIPHETILRGVWGGHSIERIGYLRLAIRELRRKLELDPAHPRYILTEPRVGYRLVIATRPARVRGKTAS